ncbi:hypothetical protein PT2222_90213 [Paraburkholderia tropica]
MGAGLASSGRFGFRFVARGHFDRHRRQHRFQCARACRERAFLTRREALDPVFGARSARAIGEFELREHLHGLARARVARARAVGVLRETRGHVDGDARVDAAVGAFEQVEKPRHISGSDDREAWVSVRRRLRSGWRYPRNGLCSFNSCI